MKRRLSDIEMLDMTIADNYELNQATTIWLKDLLEQRKTSPLALVHYLGVEGYAEGGYTVPILASIQSAKPAGTVANVYMDGLIETLVINNDNDLEKVANAAATLYSTASKGAHRE